MQPAPRPPALRGLTYCRNSCFLDSLIMALLHRPSATLRACMEDSSQKHHPVAAELCLLLHFIHGSGPAGPAMTCTTLRQLLFAGMQQRGYENPADGRPRDATEVLKALLEILRVPDTLRVQRRAEIRLEGDSEKWIQRDKNPAPEPHGTDGRLPSTARTMGRRCTYEEQEVEGRLDDEDMEQMARLRGAPLPTPRYTRRRTP